MPQRTSVSDLFTGKVRSQKPKGRGKKAETPPQSLPPRLAKLADLFVAGRVIEREIEFKAGFARQELDAYLIEDYGKRFAARLKRPSGTEYVGGHSRFKYVVTSRTSLTLDKVESLRALGIAVDEHTETRGVRIDAAAIREHGLEDRLRAALESLDIPPHVLEECFVPQIELKDTFYDLLPEMVRQSLRKGEDLAAKLVEALRLLAPSTQIRNAEALDLDLGQCLQLIERTEIEASPEDDDDAA